MRKRYLLPLFIIIVAVVAGCSQDSAEKIRYDMEKLVYMAGKLAERINIQPQLATASDSLALKNAHEKIIEYFQKYRQDDLVAGNDQVLKEMSRMAVTAQVQLARYYAGHRQPDSVLAAYRRIGTDIPAGQGDIFGASLSLALTYRALGVYDSTFAIYDRLLKDFYPPVDSLQYVNVDVIAIPIDKVKMGQAYDDPEKLEGLIQEAIEYYHRLRRDFPENEFLVRRAMVNASRVYTMTEQWDDAIAQLEQISDSTGQVDIAALVLIANIYNGPKEDVNRAIELYRQILEREPDSSIIGSTMLQLGMALCDQGDHDEGRKVLADLKKKFAARPGLISKSQYYYAQSFEVQGRWDRALSEYQWLMENHPYAEESFWAARRIPEHFEKEGNRKLADTWFDRSIDFYLRAASIKQGEPVEVAAYTYLAEIYRIIKKWDKALETLDKIHALAPKTALGAKALYNAASVAYKELNDSTLARNYLNRLNREFGTTDSTQIYEEEEPVLDLESLE